MADVALELVRSRLLLIKAQIIDSILYLSAEIPSTPTDAK
jgi:hypothetical protein